jgi:hypothetical protein
MRDYTTDKTAAVKKFMNAIKFNNLDNLKEELKVDCGDAKLDLKLGIISKSTYDQVVAVKDYLISAIEVHQHTNP